MATACALPYTDSPMEPTEFPKKLSKLTESVGRPNFVIYGWKDDNGKTQISYSLHKMTLKEALRAILKVLGTIIEKNLK